MSTRTKADVRALEQLRSLVRMERARIGFSDEQVETLRAKRNRRMADDTAEIREATRVYRETWIEPLIDALIAGDARKIEELLR